MASSKQSTTEISGLGRRAAKPLPNPRADPKSHELDPVTAFVLSRVDGKSTYGDICAISGLSEIETVTILRRLHEEKLILAEGEPAVVPPKRPAPEPQAVPPRSGHEARPDGSPGGSEERRTKKGKRDEAKRGEGAEEHDKKGQARSVLVFLDDRSSVDPLLMAEAPTMEEETKLRILRAHKRLPGLDYYDLLGLEPGADARGIKRAYFAASKELHPDRYYGKDIGPFRQMLADLFARSTEAFEHLLDDKRRAEYETAARERRARREPARRR